MSARTAYWTTPSSVGEPRMDRRRDGGRRDRCQPDRRTEWPGYGDRNGDGTIDGTTDAGLLPGLDGDPDGLANSLAYNSCIERDVLGGPWDDPSARWTEMTSATRRDTRDGNGAPIGRLAAGPNPRTRPDHRTSAAYPPAQTPSRINVTVVDARLRRLRHRLPLRRQPLTRRLQPQLHRRPNHPQPRRRPTRHQRRASASTPPPTIDVIADVDGYCPPPARGFNPINPSPTARHPRRHRRTRSAALAAGPNPQLASHRTRRRTPPAQPTPSSST